MNLAPNCSSITHLRYGGLGSWLNLPWLPPSYRLPPPTHTEPCSPRSQACKNNICLDLSPGHGLDGRLTGHRVETWDVKVCAHVDSVCRKCEHRHLCAGWAGVALCPGRS